MEFRTEEFARRPMMAMAHKGAYHEIGDTWTKLFTAVGPLGWMGPDTFMAGIYLDDPQEVPEESLRSYACLTCPDGASAPEGMESREIGGGKYLIGRYVGAYSGLGDAWGEAMAEAGKHNEREGECYEVYVTHDEEHPERSITDIYIPIE
jgi:AraC family transcriptional regulator